MSNVTLLEHPLIQHKITLLRNRATNPKDFRELIAELSMIMAYEATRDLPVRKVDIETPIGFLKSPVINSRKLTLAPVMRAGLIMLDGVLRFMPAAKVGHIGIYRDPEDFGTTAYYMKLPPDMDERDVIVLEPVIATANTVLMALDCVTEAGCSRIKLLSVIGSVEGVRKLQLKYPEVDTYVCAIDPSLDEFGFIMPGLGDVGARMFGIK